LEELYASYNFLSELSGLVGHDCLQVLDVEGNKIQQVGDLEDLGVNR